MKIYLIYLSNNYGGACQALLAFKKFLDEKGISNQVICPEGPVLTPDIEISNKKYKSILRVLFFILYKNTFKTDKKNFFFLNTIINAPFSIFKNTILWVHETTLDGRSVMFMLFKLIANNFARESYYVNNSMSLLFPKARLFEIPYNYLENICTSSTFIKSNEFIACMIVRPLNKKGINYFIKLSSQSNDNFVILTQPKLFHAYCHKNSLIVPDNLYVKDFNNIKTRKKILSASTFHLNLSELPETVGLNTIEAISYGCICMSTNNAGSRLILDKEYIIHGNSGDDLIINTKLLMTKFNSSKYKEINQKQYNKIFNKKFITYTDTFLEDVLKKV